MSHNQHLIQQTEWISIKPTNNCATVCSKCFVESFSEATIFAANNAQPRISGRQLFQDLQGAIGWTSIATKSSRHSGWWRTDCTAACRCGPALRHGIKTETGALVKDPEASKGQLNRDQRTSSKVCRDQAGLSSRKTKGLLTTELKIYSIRKLSKGMSQSVMQVPPEGMY